MDYERFIMLVSEGAGAGREEAELAARTTLQTLGERLDEGEVRDLMAQLPPELAAWLGHKGPGEAFDVDEFLRRIAEREGVDPAAAEHHARIVFTVLGQALSDKELGDLAAQLPKDYAPLLPRGPAVETESPAEFVAHVAEHASIDPEAARRAADAVLETLAERIAGGEVQDLIVRLPVALHAPLKRGVERTGGSATRMTLDEFVSRVAEREGVSLLDARDHARAVLAALREAVGDDEFFDVTVQLPEEYGLLLAR
jgi:uncharacterized protein (DUF2267 family)